MAKYKIYIEFDAAQLAPTAIGKVMDQLNGTMQGFGFTEKVVAVTTIPFDLTTARDLTKEETSRLLEIIVEETSKKFGPVKISEFEKVE
jgi:hypothetical protein